MKLWQHTDRQTDTHTRTPLHPNTNAFWKRRIDEKLEIRGGACLRYTGLVVKKSYSTVQYSTVQYFREVKRGLTRNKVLALVHVSNTLPVLRLKISAPPTQRWSLLGRRLHAPRQEPIISSARIPIPYTALTSPTLYCCVDPALAKMSSAFRSGATHLRCPAAMD